MTLRKLIVRTLIVGALFFALVLICLCVAGYMAFQQPEFYSQISAGDAVDFEKWMLQQQADLKQWTETSVKNQRRIAELGDASDDQYDPRLDTHSISVSELQLNEILRSRLKKVGSVQDPRVKLSADQMQLGVQVAMDESLLVLSVSLKPSVSTEGRIHFEIQSGHIGNLRVPLHTILKMLQAEMTTHSSTLKLDSSGPNPVFVWNHQQRKEVPAVQAVHCSDGALEITFQAPVVDKP